MTDPVVRIEDVRLAVEPGGQVQTTITVQNLGDIVEGYRLEVLGDGASTWGRLLPDEIQVYPGSESVAILMFTPPADAAAGSGSFPFAVRVRSVVDDDSSTVIEGDLELGRVFGLQAKLTPVTSTGRWRGQHLVEFTNWGNAPVRLKLTAADPDEKLAFLVYPEVVEVPIGATTGAAIRVRTRKPFLRGPQIRMPFGITAEPDPPEPAAVGPAGPLPVIADPRRAAADGAFNQRPIVSKAVVVLGVLLLAAVAAGIFFLVKSTPAAVAPAALGTGVPRTPVVAVATGSDTTVMLQWAGEPSLDPYKLYTVTAEGRTSAVVAVDGALDTFTVTGLTPGTRYCFRLQAVRGKTASGLSEPQCAQTATAAVTGSSGPATVTLTAPSGSVQPVVTSGPAVSGPAVSGPAVSGPAVSGPAVSGPVASGPASVPLGPTPAVPVVVPPAGPSGPVSDGQTPPPPTGPTVPGSTAVPPPTSGVPLTSPVAPVSTGAATPTAPTTASVSSGTAAGPIGFKATDFIAVIAVVPNVESTSPQSAAFAQQQAVAAGLPAQILRTGEHPDLRLYPGSGPPADSFLVWVGPFGSRALADSFCATRPSCLTVQPNPNG